MLVVAALVPDTALLVPGAAGRAVVLEDVRAAALAAVGEALRIAPDRVVVVAPGTVDRVLTGPVRASLAAAGIDDARLGWGRPDRALTQPLAGPRPAPAVPASTALLALAQLGWTGPTTVVEVAPVAPALGAPPIGSGPAGRADGARALALQSLGADLVAGGDRVALVVAGSLSARSGPRAPLPQDGRAALLDSSVLADLASSDADARRRLAATSGSLAGELAMTAWAPLQVLLGAAAGAPEITSGPVHRSAPFGVTYMVALWRVGGAPAAGVSAAPAWSALPGATP